MDVLERYAVQMTKRELLTEVNLRPGQLEILLKVLEVEGAVEPTATDAFACSTTTGWLL